MQRAAWNYSAGGAIVPKNSGTCFIDCFPEVYVSNGDVQLENAVPVATGGLENCVHVVERLFGLFLDRAELLLPACRIDPKLARDEDETVVDRCLRVMSSGLRRVMGVDSFNFHDAYDATKRKDNIVDWPIDKLAFVDQLIRQRLLW